MAEHDSKEESTSTKQQILAMVDEFFLGNKVYRLQMLRRREQVLLGKARVGTLIGILLDDNKYLVPRNFEETFGGFLDKNLTLNDV